MVTAWSLCGLSCCCRDWTPSNWSSQWRRGWGGGKHKWMHAVGGSAPIRRSVVWAGAAHTAKDSGCHGGDNYLDMLLSRCVLLLKCEISTPLMGLQSRLARAA